MPASDRLKSVTAFNPAGDGGMRASAATTNDGTGTTHIIGPVNASNIRRYVKWYTLAEVLGMIDSGQMVFTVTASSASTAQAGIRAITDQVAALVEGNGGAGSGLTYATVDGSTAWTTVGAKTDTGSSPGHNCGTQVHTFSMPTGAGTLTLSGAGLKAVLQEAADYALTNKIYRCAFLMYAVDETNDTGQTFTIASNNNATASARPTLAFDVIPAIYSDLTNHIEVEAIPDSSNRRVSLQLSDWSFISGDTLTLEHSASSDLSSPTTETPVALHTLSENDWVHFTIASGRYYRFKASLTAGTPVVCPGAILQANAASAALPDGVIRGVPRVRSETTTLGAVRVAGMAAFAEDDVFIVQYGTASGSLASLSDPFTLPQAVGRASKATFGPLVAGTRYWYRVHILEDGNYHLDSEHTFKHLVADDEDFAFIFHADLHALFVYLEYIGNRSFEGFYPGSHCPQTYRQQLVELAATYMLAELGPDGFQMAMQICLGDGWAQGKHNSGSQAYPLDENGDPVGEERFNYVTDQDQANYTLHLTAGNDLTLADIPAEVEVPANHRGSHAFEYGNSSGVTGRNTLTGPEVSPAEWLIDAQDEHMGNPSDSDIYLAGSDPLGRWGGFDRGYARFIWIDVYLHSILSSTDPNDLPVTYDSVNDWTIGELYDWLFNPSTGVVTTCDKPHLILMAHNWTGGEATGGTGPDNYGWGGIKVASPHGEAPVGEWPGASDWQTADAYGYGGEDPGTWQNDLHTYGVHKSIVRRRPAGTQVYLFDGHSHFFCIENGGDGIVYHQIGRVVGDDGDLKFKGPYSQGHRAGNSGGSFGYEDELRPGDFWCNNGGYMRVDVTERTLRLRIRKVWSNFEGQYVAAYPHSVQVSTADFAAGSLLGNPGPEAIEQTTKIVFDRTYYHPDAPAPSFSDSFNRFVEDGTTMEAAGTEQPALAVGAANQATTESGAYWKNYSSDDEAYLAVRASVIDAANVLSTRRPVGAEDPDVVQQIRRTLSPVNRRISVDVRLENLSSLVAIQLGGGDTNYGFVAFDEWNDDGFGLFLVSDGTGKLQLVIATTSGYELLATTADIVLDTDWVTIESTIVAGKVVVKVDGATVIDHALISPQRTYYEGNGAWVGLVGMTNNVTDEGFIVEFRNFEASAASASDDDRSILHPGHPFSLIRRRRLLHG